MKNRSATRISGLWALALGAWVGSACGGRAVTIEGAGGSDAVSGGSSSVGGSSPGRGGSVAQGGCSSGCLNIGCGTNMVSMTVPGACCPVCVPCPPCPFPICGSGFHAEVPDGECCAACVPDPMRDACVTGQANYLAYSQQVIAKAQALPCMVDGDCTVVTLINACSNECQMVATLSSVSESLVNGLSQAALMDCGTCPGPPDIGCSTAPPACLNAKCQIFVNTMR